MSILGTVICNVTKTQGISYHFNIFVQTIVPRMEIWEAHAKLQWITWPETVTGLELVSQPLYTSISMFVSHFADHHGWVRQMEAWWLTLWWCRYERVGGRLGKSKRVCDELVWLTDRPGYFYISLDNRTAATHNNFLVFTTFYFSLFHNSGGVFSNTSRNFSEAKRLLDNYPIQ